MYFKAAVPLISYSGYKQSNLLVLILGLTDIIQCIRVESGQEVRFQYLL